MEFSALWCLTYWQRKAHAMYSAGGWLRNCCCWSTFCKMMLQPLFQMQIVMSKWCFPTWVANQTYTITIHEPLGFVTGTKVWGQIQALIQLCQECRALKSAGKAKAKASCKCRVGKGACFSFWTQVCDVWLLTWTVQGAGPQCLYQI